MINICPNCKNVIGNNDTYCKKCGINILDFKEDMKLKEVEPTTPLSGSNHSANNEPHPSTTQTAAPIHQDSNNHCENETTDPYELMDLRADTGIIKLKPISKKEAEKYPDNVVKVANANYEPNYYRKITIIPPEKEEFYLMLRISKDLHFISTLLKVLLTLSIIAGAIGLFIWMGSCV